MIIAAFVIVCVFVYLGIAGYTGVKFYNWRMDECSWCNHGRVCHDDHFTAALGASLFWPLIVPICVGAFMATREPKHVRIASKIRSLEKELNF